MPKSRAVQCVHWRDRETKAEGWCALRRGLGKHDENRGTDSVETKCGLFVIAPGRFEKRVPTCEECRAD